MKEIVYKYLSDNIIEIQLNNIFFIINSESFDLVKDKKLYPKLNKKTNKIYILYYLNSKYHSLASLISGFSHVFYLDNNTTNLQLNNLSNFNNNNDNNNFNINFNILNDANYDNNNNNYILGKYKGSIYNKENKLIYELKIDDNTKITKIIPDNDYNKALYYKKYYSNLYNKTTNLIKIDNKIINIKIKDIIIICDLTFLDFVLNNNLYYVKSKNKHFHIYTIYYKQKINNKYLNKKFIHHILSFHNISFSKTYFKNNNCLNLTLNNIGYII